MDSRTNSAPLGSSSPGAAAPPKPQGQSGGGPGSPLGLAALAAAGDEGSCASTPREGSPGGAADSDADADAGFLNNHWDPAGPAAAAAAVSSVSSLSFTSSRPATAPAGGLGGPPVSTSEPPSSLPSISNSGGSSSAGASPLASPSSASGLGGGSGGSSCSTPASSPRPSSAGPRFRPSSSASKPFTSPSRPPRPIAAAAKKAARGASPPPAAMPATRSLHDIGALSPGEPQRTHVRKGPPSVDGLLSAIDERGGDAPPEKQPAAAAADAALPRERSSCDGPPTSPPAAAQHQPLHPAGLLRGAGRRKTDIGSLHDGAAPQASAPADCSRQPPAASSSSSLLSPSNRGAAPRLGQRTPPEPSASPASTTPTKPGQAPPGPSAKAESPLLDRIPSASATSLAAPSAMPSLWEYLAEEARPGPSVAVADPIWGATDRDVMYNSLISVPYQLERLMLFGLAVCIDPFLSTFTTVPLRALKAVWDLLQGLAVRARRLAGANLALKQPGPLVRGDQLFDMLYMIIFAFAAWVVNSLNAGVIYFWMKDLSQEFVKLSVIFTAMEICDKILTSFGVSALHALSCSCTQFASGSGSGALQVASDFLLSAIITTGHAVALMSEAIAFSVAMNSRRTTLLALVISFNFAEVKGTVFKKFDPNKLTPIIFQDIVERFHMLVLMLFVMIEEMDASESWGVVNWQLLVQVGVILASELAADIAKHAIVGKFNVIRPGVYREYMRDLCEATAKSHSNTLFKAVQIEPLGTAAIFCRMILSFLSYLLAPLTGKPPLQQIPALAAMALTYGAICLLKLAWGFLVRWAAARYLVYYEDKYGKAGRSHKASAAVAAANKKDN